MGHRENLLAGAKKCLLEKGYSRTTARDIVAASGTNLGSIGYHYGSMQALMNAAMLAAMGDWSQAVAEALTGGEQDPEQDPLVRYWTRLIDGVQSNRSLWLTSIDAMVASEHSPELRAQVAEGIELGRSGMAALLTGLPPHDVDEETIRTLGSVQMALMSGVIIQWLADPARAPSPAQIVRGLRALATL